MNYKVIRTRPLGIRRQWQRRRVHRRSLPLIRN